MKITTNIETMKDDPITRMSIRKSRYIAALLIPVFFFIEGCVPRYDKEISSAKDVISRTAGTKYSSFFDFKIDKKNTSGDSYTVNSKNGKVTITGTSSVALCRGAYDYLRNACNSIVTWSGNHISIPDTLPEYTSAVTSPYRYRYYFNVVTHGYTTPFWDWARWEKEIDWMALHGINMPLMGGAYEAILYRVFRKLGLSEEVIGNYFTGPAYLPWNRMGNITRIEGPLPASFFEKQIKLNHQIINRMRELGMTPIIQSFAGFVPAEIRLLYPDAKIRDLRWALPKDYSGHILEPGSPLFVKIGGMFIKEWESEFGKAGAYLADSFNEMRVPLSEDSTKALKELALYGKSVYQSINQADPDAIWVMQGWTFINQRDKDGKFFWTPKRLAAFLSDVPNDKLMILDMANEYNRLVIHMDPSWKTYNGFFGKQWIYSFIPNMGGKTSWNGKMDMYASMPVEALHYEKRGDLVGFGFAPEGIENNEIIYELLSDMGWTDKAINIEEWIPQYCRDRYGAFPEQMKTAWNYFLQSCYGDFADVPAFKYQFGPLGSHIPYLQATVNKSPGFVKGVAAFLQCNDVLGDSKLYQYDALECSTQYLGLKTDELLNRFEKGGKKDYALLNEAIDLMTSIDRLLLSHPNFRLKRWIDFARNFGDTPEEKDSYEADSKLLLTLWGYNGEIINYAARTWSGLTADFYIPRWKLYYDAEKEHRKFDLLAWEKQWVKTPWTSKSQAFDHPLEEAKRLVFKYQATDTMKLKN
jgi:alpha-N-acetylglucosaminidase